MTRTVRLLLGLPLLTAALAVGCAALERYRLDREYGAPTPRDAGATDTAAAQNWARVKAVLDARCVVCHACYDAPCQLNLTAPEGIERGASREKVYDALRLVAAEPTRLFEDADSTAAWRDKGFFPVLNERDPTPRANLEGGVMARMLALKQAGAARARPDLDADAECPRIEAFDQFAQRTPERGMPFALPALAAADYATLRDWLRDGAPMPVPAAPAPALAQRMQAWEAFFNRDDAKARLASRYLYEHLFLADLYFDDLPPGTWLRLVRSRTPGGQPIERIVTRRPFDDPGRDRFYYRLQPVSATVVAKTHMPYALNRARMEKWRRWFLDTEWTAPARSDYDPEVASNPFLAFRAIPLASRYRFLLDEAEFTIMGFIKGPVCRGQVALNVIDDRFWVFFADPDSELIASEADFLAREAMNLRLPAEHESNAAVLVNWLEYSELQKQYLEAKAHWLQNHFAKNPPVDLKLIWDGDGRNPNAALTVFRHFDSATVTTGLVGTEPKTAWIIGYGLLERIHYLLVAGFDVYGNVGHQLDTRLYMDFLRMEGEQNFLGMLPADVRVRERDHWYRGGSDEAKDYLYGTWFSPDVPSAIAYTTDDPKAELLARLRARVGAALDTSANLEPARPGARALQRLAQVTGIAASLMPEVSLLAVPAGNDLQLYTITADRGFSSISHLTDEENWRIPEEDALTVAAGVLTAYPSAFFLIEPDRLDAFATAVAALKADTDLDRLVARFGVARQDPRFWRLSDDVHRRYREVAPVDAALLDYNRLQH